MAAERVQVAAPPARRREGAGAAAGAGHAHACAQEPGPALGAPARFHTGRKEASVWPQGRGTSGQGDKSHLIKTENVCASGALSTEGEGHRGKSAELASTRGLTSGTRENPCDNPTPF